jgi:hypothetical protein
MLVTKKITKQSNASLPTADGLVTLTHHQTIRQSASYQSAEVNYGATITVEAKPKVYKAALRRLEGLVEEALIVKLAEQRDVLKALAKANH